MNHFMIGQYGGFDYNKYRRDYKDGFYGIEACLFNTEEDVENLVRESGSRGFNVGIHFPLRAGRSSLRDALFLSSDQRERENAYRWIEQELDYLARVQPVYVLFHYPKPVLLDDRVDWSNWRFADRKEFVMESLVEADEFFERSEYLFQWLSAKGEEYRFTPVLEFDALNKYVYEGNRLEQLLLKYDKIKLCLDTGRLHLQEKLDPYFNSRKVIGKYAKYAEVIHLWNIKYTAHIEEYHYPVLPEQSPEEGWAPIEDYLNIIKEENKTVKIQFEHRSDLISDADLERGYRWVDEILNGGSSS